jgi:hypothetical protein
VVPPLGWDHDWAGISTSCFELDIRKTRKSSKRVILKDQIVVFWESI